jgi:hypothetical protein
VTTFSTKVSRARLRRARPSGPWPGSCSRREQHRGSRWTTWRYHAVGGRARGESRCRVAASLARCLQRCRASARAAAAAPFPRTRRRLSHPPSRIPDGRDCKSRRAVLPRRACCRRESRASTLWNEYSLGSCSHPHDASPLYAINSGGDIADSMVARQIARWQFLRALKALLRFNLARDNRRRGSHG